MKRFALMISALVCLGTPAYAEGIPAVDVFGGFSIDHVSSGIGKVTFTGWQANAAFNVHGKIALVTDFAGEYKRDEDGQFLYLFGPRLHRRMEKWTVFGEALFGGDRIDGESLFAMAYGGGVEVPVGKIRLRSQFDWIPVRLGAGDPWLKNQTRFGFGLVIPLGGE